MKTPWMILLCMMMLAGNACALEFPNWYGYDIMAIECNGFLVEMTGRRISTRTFDGNKFTFVTELKNNDFKDYNFRAGAIVQQGNRLWIMGGTATINNRKEQLSDKVLTCTVSDQGLLQGLKEVRSLPYPALNGRALIHDNRLWLLGGYGHCELHSAQILPDGNLGPWTPHRSYPMSVSSGGFVFYKGCFYANGKTGYWPGAKKMFAIKLTQLAKGRPWRRVDAPPDKAMGRLFIHQDKLTYFDEVSGNIYQTTQEDDGLQLKEWTVAGTMPCPPETEGVTVVPTNGGWFIFGGVLRKDKKFIGFYKGAFLPWTSLKQDSPTTTPPPAEPPK